MTKKFYTNIERRGNHILYRGYDNGQPVQQKIEYKPHLFINGKNGEKTEHRLFKTNAPLIKRDFDNIKEMQEFIESYKDVRNFGIYGCKDVVRQFTGNNFRGEIDWDYEATQVWFIDIETRVASLTLKDDADPDYKVMTRKDDESESKEYSIWQAIDLPEDYEIYDLETEKWFKIPEFHMITRMGFPHPDKAAEEILMISMYNHHTGRMVMWSLLDADEDNPIFTEFPDIEFLYFDNEKTMLKDFIVFFTQTRIDVLSGWNSESFDLPYIVNRIKNVLGDGIVKLLSPWGVVKPRQVKTDNMDIVNTYDILGVTHLDYLHLYKKFNPGSKESFKLDYIAEIELGQKKVEMPCATFKEFYLLHPNTFIHYNGRDTVLLHSLEKKLLQVRLAMQMAFIAKCQFGDVLSAMRLWESIIYNYFLDDGVVEELGKVHKGKDKIVGAYVHEPVPGQYDWIVTKDASALYPSMIMQHNISPETIVGMIATSIEDIVSGNIPEVKSGTCLSANGLITTNAVEGFIPHLLNKMGRLRREAKNKMLEYKKEEQNILAQLKELGVE